MGFSYSTDKKQRGSGYDFTDTENTKFTFGGLSKSIDEISAKIQQEKGNVENVVQQVDDNSSPKVLDVDNVFQKASKGWDKQKVSNKRAKHTAEGKQKKTLGILKIMGFFSKKGVKNVTVQKHDAEYTDKLKCSDTKMDSHRPSKKIKTKNKITKKDCTDREEKMLVSGVTMEDSKQDDSESLIKNVTAIEKTQEHHQEYTATRESTDTSENTLIMKTPSLEVGIKIKELDFGSYDLEDFQKYPAPPVTAKINILKEPEKVDKEDESVCGEDAFVSTTNNERFEVYCTQRARQANIDTIERAIAQFEDVNPAMARRTSKFLALYREMSKLETIYEIDEEELATFEVFNVLIENEGEKSRYDSASFSTGSSTIANNHSMEMTCSSDVPLQNPDTNIETGQNPENRHQSLNEFTIGGLTLNRKSSAELFLDRVNCISSEYTHEEVYHFCSKKEWIMLSISQKYNGRVRSVPVSTSSLNASECFVIYCGSVNTLAKVTANNELVSEPHPGRKIISPFSNYRNSTITDRTQRLPMFKHDSDFVFNGKLLKRNVYVWKGASSDLDVQKLSVNIATDITQNEINCDSKIIELNILDDDVDVHSFLQWMHYYEYKRYLNQAALYCVIDKLVNDLDRTNHPSADLQLLSRKMALYRVSPSDRLVTLVSNDYEISAVELIRNQKEFFMILDTYDDIFIWCKDKRYTLKGRIDFDCVYQILHHVFQSRDHQQTKVWYEFGSLEHVAFKNQFYDWDNYFSDMRDKTAPNG